MTETCGSVVNGSDPTTPAGSLGKVVPFGEIRVHPESGELLLQSPHQMMGYYKNPEKTAELFVDGWMHNGNKGAIDDDGYVRIIGRVQDVFKTSKGNFVTPNPLEKLF